MSCGWPSRDDRFNVMGEMGEPKAQNDPARRDAMAAMIFPPAWVKGERLTTTQVGLVMAASFRT